MHEDLTLEGDYAEPFDALLDPKVFELAGTEEGNTKESEGQITANRSLLDLFRAKNTKTRTNFFSAGLSMSILVRSTGLEPARDCSH